MSMIERVARDLNKFGRPIDCNGENWGDCSWFDVGGEPYSFYGYSGGGDRAPINDPAPPVVVSTPTATTCNCLTGTAYIENGICKCCDGVVIDGACAGGIKTATPPTTPITSVSILTAPTPSAASILDTIKANPIPAALIGLGVVFLILRK